MNGVVLLQLLVVGVTGEGMVSVQQRVVVLPVRGQGYVTILHLMMVGRRVREQIQTYICVTSLHVQVRFTKFLCLNVFYVKYIILYVYLNINSVSLYIHVKGMSFAETLI